MSAWRVSADIGGTFTDIVLLSPDGRVRTKKVSSSVDNYARAIADGLVAALREAEAEGADVAEVLHATTVGSNAILELAGAKTGLITTRGFRDVLEIRTLRMPRLYDLAWQKPPPLVERALRLEVTERIAANGDIVVPLAESEVAAATDRLLAEGVEAIAVSFLHSYANPAHELAAGRIIRERAPHVTLCLSSEILPEIREYERTSTTVINAYVRPIIERYLERLQSDLRRIGISAPLLLMQSNGGLTTAEVASKLPMHVIESGPAAGVVGAQAVARRLGIDRVITFDMGGTTAKASLVEEGEVTRAEEYAVGAGIMIGSRLLSGAGYALKVPAIDLAEVGAGGGSIVWIDAGGVPRVGPRSAGAVPGPVCYAAGGTEPTITDASVILGYVNPRHLVGGAVRLDAARAARVFEEKVARPLGLSLERAAYGAHQIVASNMIRAIRAVSSERGRDPRRFTLFAFGGNGGIFAAAMARTLGIGRVIVPPAAGVFSSLGLLYSEVEYHFSRTHRGLTTELDPESVDAAFRRLEAEALSNLERDGYSGERVEIRRSAKLRYQGQSYELPAPVRGGRITAAAIAEMAEAFAVEHERTYGHRAGKEEPVELMNIQVTGRGLSDRPRVPDRLRFENLELPATGSLRRAYFGPDAGWLEVPVLARDSLGGSREGPLIIEEYDSTTVVSPGTRASLDPFGNVRIEIGSA